MSTVRRALLTAIYRGRLDDAKTVCEECEPVLNVWRDADFEPSRVAILAPKPTAEMVEFVLDSGSDAFVSDSRTKPSPAALAFAISLPEDILDVILEYAFESYETTMHVACYAAQFGNAFALTRLEDIAEREDNHELRKLIAFAQCFHKLDVSHWSAERYMSVYMDYMDSKSPWHAAAFRGNLAPFRETSFWSMHSSCERASPNFLLDEKKRSVLMYAIDGEKGHDIDFISLLMLKYPEFETAKPFSVIALENYGAPLHFACRRRNRIGVIKLLLDTYGVDCNAVDAEDMRTPLHTALGNCIELEAIKALDAAGANFFSRCRLGWIPLFYLLDGVARDEARQPGRGDLANEHETCVKYVLQRHTELGDTSLQGASTTALMIACLHDMKKYVEIILLSVPSMKNLMAVRDSRRRTAYHWACERQATGAIEILKRYDLLTSDITEMLDDTGRTGAELLRDAVHVPRKHRHWAPRITKEYVFPDFAENDDIMASIVAARAKYAKAFAEDGEDGEGRRKMKLRTCRACFAYTDRARRCSQCKTTYYCTPECQKRDWSAHKVVCLPAPTVKDALAEGARLTRERSR